MEWVSYNAQNKPQVDKKAAFCELVDVIPPSKDFDDSLNNICAAILAKHPFVTQDALKNVRGSWYQWLLASSAWNYYCDGGVYLAALLPNKTRFDIANLYEDRLRDFITDLRQKVSQHANVELVTSNPDFVIMKASDLILDLPFTGKLTSFNSENLDALDRLYEAIVGRCNFDNLIGYISVKTSFRPDRRLQIPHEGSLMKAIYAHLQTRDWIINPKGLRYYAIAMKVGPADKEALRTVATHSITTVNEVPKAAVDNVFVINSEAEAQGVWHSILRA